MALPEGRSESNLKGRTREMRMREGSTGCAGGREQLIQPKPRLRSHLCVPFMCPGAWEVREKSYKVSLRSCSSPVKGVFYPGWGWQTVGQQQGRGKGLVGWRNLPGISILAWQRSKWSILLIADLQPRWVLTSPYFFRGAGWPWREGSLERYLGYGWTLPINTVK